jgi:lysozyme
MRDLPDCLKPFLELHEGRSKKPYPDSEGTWTIGIGHTGPEVHPGLLWTDAQIDAQYEWDAKAAACSIPLSLATINRLGQCQYAALISFVFNAGPVPKATLWKRIKAGKLDQVPVELAKWNKAHVRGEVVTLSGLVNRRAAEVELWLDDAPAEPYINTSAPHVEVLPTSSAPATAARSATFLAAFGGALTTGPAIVNQAITSVQPYAIHSGYVQRLISVLAALGAALALFALVRVYVGGQEAAR